MTQSDADELGSLRMTAFSIRINGAPTPNQEAYHSVCKW